MRVKASLVCLAFGAALSGGAAEAHHPGSHATRQPDGRVKIEAVAQASDTCTRISGIRSGTPSSVTAPGGSVAVTILLQRGGEACAAAVTAVRAESLLDAPRSATEIFLYVQGADGSLIASERVPIR